MIARRLLRWVFGKSHLSNLAISFGRVHVTKPISPKWLDLLPTTLVNGQSFFAVVDVLRVIFCLFVSGCVLK